MRKTSAGTLAAGQTQPARTKAEPQHWVCLALMLSLALLVCRILSVW
jgi:hypothetical protein